MKILSCGAGMQSTALALMACENAINLRIYKKAVEQWTYDEKRSFFTLPQFSPKHPAVPIYDAIIFCDLGFEPAWVKSQVDFIDKSCAAAGIPFKVLDSPLYKDFMTNFGERRTISIPWWTLKEDGYKSCMPRNCTIDYKVELITKYVRWDLLGYRKGQWLRDEDKKAHEMHMGFSAEEKRRCKESPNKMFVNKFPLVEMGYTRADSYAYIRETWGLDTKASACCFCPFHRNHFYQHLKINSPAEYKKLLELDELLQNKNPKPPMDSDLFISRNRVRLADLTPEDCDDAEYFEYKGQKIWNGF